MVTKLNRPLVLLVVLALALAAAVPALAEQRYLPGDCSSIQAWVEENAANLPHTYEDLSEFPMAYRRAIFNALSAKAKSDLWRTHLQNQLDTADLTDAQRRIIEQAVELTVPQLFTHRVDRLTRLRMAVFEKAARDQFDHATARRIFTQLGMAEANSQTSVRIIAGGTACSCNNGDDWCPDGYGCDETTGCDVIKDACGWWWMDDCNGTCEDPSNNLR